jgi:hypothetical protein
MKETGTMFYTSKVELEAAERRPKGYVAYRRKRDGAWIYVTASTATTAKGNSAAQQKRDEIMREKYEVAMAEKRAREAAIDRRPNHRPISVADPAHLSVHDAVKLTGIA